MYTVNDLLIKAAEMNASDLSTILNLIHKAM